MTPEIKQRWLDALRSGQYQHGRMRLQTRDGRFCCLGVLCDLIKDQVGGAWRQQAGSEIVFKIPGQAYSDAMLSNALLDYAGITHTDAMTLAALNDGSNKEPPKTFAEIADWIEANL